MYQLIANRTIIASVLTVVSLGLTLTGVIDQMWTDVYIGEITTTILGVTTSVFAYRDRPAAVPTA